METKFNAGRGDPRLLHLDWGGLDPGTQRSHDSTELDHLLGFLESTGTCSGDLALCLLGTASVAAGLSGAQWHIRAVISFC